MDTKQSNGTHDAKVGNGYGDDSAHNGDKLTRVDSVQHLDGNGKDVILLYRNCTPLLYWDWLFRFWIYFDTPAHWISWYAAAGFFFGGAAFIIGSFAGIAPAIAATEVVGNCMGDANDWLVTFAYFVGDCLWQVAVVFQMIEALNPNFDARVFEWHENGCKGPKPMYRWLGIAPRNLDWWGAFSYTVGVALYWIAAVSTMINDCPNTLMATDVYLWLVDYFYLIAGILFLLAGAFYCMHESSIYLVPAIFCPFNREDATSLKWWALNIYFWGGVCYCMAGVQLYFDSPINLVETTMQYNIITGVGFGGGSVCFFVGATLLLARQSRGRCRPSYGTIGRLDPTIHMGHANVPLNSGRSAANSANNV